VRGTPFPLRLSSGLLKPKHKILGLDIAGRVEAVGSNVKQFQPGDDVFGVSDFGAFAEYVSAPEAGLVLKPANISFEQAAAAPAVAFSALQGLRDKGQIQPGQQVLINGACGSVGTAAVQLAHYFGAEVTGVCGPANLELVKSLGADQVIDYTQEDFTQSGQSYHIIFDAVSVYDAVSQSSFSRCKGSLRQEGVYLSFAFGLPILLQMLWTSKVGSKKAIFSATGLRPVPERLIFLKELKELIEAGKIKQVIDRRYPLEQIAEAHRYVEKGHKKGNVVITVEHNSKA
jgi:NADPH:quinone reductase-like Zn-dependent oxidoreductase